MLTNECGCPYGNCDCDVMPSNLPPMRQPHVAIFCKTGKQHHGRGPYNAGGLASNAMHSVAVLRKMGVQANLFLVERLSDIIAELADTPSITVAIIEAVWVKASDAIKLAQTFPHVQIVVRAHSKIGFLQVEPEAIPVMLDIIAASKKQKNLHFSSNNEEFTRTLIETYGPCLYLPNLYDIEAAPRRRIHGRNEPLRIASFGATRLLKLHPNAALAAIQTAKRMGRDLDFYVNTDTTPGGDSVRNTIKNLCKGETDIEVSLVQMPWQPADEFKETIGSMDLVMQLSATETFCLVAADAIASGVPVIVSTAIDWVPKHYQTNADLTSEVADAAVDTLKHEERATRRQLKALCSYVKNAKTVWGKFLGLKVSGWGCR